MMNFISGSQSGVVFLDFLLEQLHLFHQRESAVEAVDVLV
jgi:hypothetical protein